MKTEDIPMLPPHMLAGWVRDNLPAHYGEIRREALAEAAALAEPQSPDVAAEIRKLA